MLYFGVRSITATAQIVAYFSSVILVAMFATNGQMVVFGNQLLLSTWSLYHVEIPVPARVQVLATPCVALPPSPVAPPSGPFAPSGPPAPSPLPTPRLLSLRLDQPDLVPSPSLSQETISLSRLAALVLAALVLSHSFTVLARLRMHRAAQWHKSHLLALKTRQQHSMIQREVAEYAAEIAHEPISRRRCTVAQVAAIYEAARLRGPEIPPKSALRPKDLRVPLLPRSTKPRSRCTEAAKRKPRWLAVIAEEA